MLASFFYYNSPLALLLANSIQAAEVEKGAAGHRDGLDEGRSKVEESGTLDGK